MKLNAVQIDRYGIFNNFQLTGLGSGFNLVHGGNGSGKSTLARYIRNVLYGFRADDSAVGGHLDVTSAHVTAKLMRDNTSANQLVSKEREGEPRSFTRADVESLNSVLQSIGSTAFDSVFFIRGNDVARCAGEVSDLLQQRFRVATGKAVFGNDYERTANSRQETDLRRELDHIEKQLLTLNSKREEIALGIKRSESDSRNRLTRIDTEIVELEARLQRQNLSVARQQIAELDVEITALRARVEQDQDRVEYVSRPFAQSDSLSILYRRLDEVDNQIRRWRNVHSDVQQQRVQLKNEMTAWNTMTVESDEHPYHRSRQILRGIETRIDGAESTIHQFRSRQDARSAHSVIENLQDCFGQLRSDLYSLCDELGSQYKNLRQRTAAAELKRLRRCYHEIGENVDSLVKHRQTILEDIHQIDPAGANAISHADHEFCACAQHDGYLHARRKFVGELKTATPEVVRVNSDASTSRLRELGNLRSSRVRELVAMENDKNELQSRLVDLRAQREGMSIESSSAWRDQLIHLDSELQRVQGQRVSIRGQLDRLASIPNIPANPIIVRASELVARLTKGEIRKLWLNSKLTGTSSSIQVEQKIGNQIEFEYLGSGLQQQVTLAMCLATAEQFRFEGIVMPMILDDVFVNLDPELIRQTLEVLIDFSDQPQQILAMTSDQTALELCRSRRVTIMDLPDTSFSPSVPLWNPDRNSDVPVREPEFLTPFTTRRHAEAPQRPLGYPQVKYPSTGLTIDHSPANFDEGLSMEPFADSPAPVLSVRHSENTVDENARLETVGICNEDQLLRLNQVGIVTLSDLLELTPHQLPENFAEFGIEREDVDQWQAVAWLLICVPALDVEDAQILNVLGIHEPEQLESTHSQQLLDRISRYLNSGEGRYADRKRSYNRDTINGWYDSLGQTRVRWRMPSGYSRRNRWQSNSSSQSSHISRSDRPERQSFGRQRGERTQRANYTTSREPRSRRDRSHRDGRLENSVSRFSRQNRESVPYREPRETDRKTVDRNTTRAQSHREPAIVANSQRESRELKFYLDMSKQLEAAPSIGPKTAERFAKIGIHTVGDFLKQTAESMAPKINYKRITAEVIRIWQHQARLVCRIPNLRGHDSQLLVACGITEPEDLADRSAQNLFAIIQPFAESKEGLKIIRGGKQPDLEEITDWINWAKDTRSLQAA